jgi:hypothetical protein
MLLWDPGDFFVDHLTSCNSVKYFGQVTRIMVFLCGRPVLAMFSSAVSYVHLHVQGVLLFVVMDFLLEAYGDDSDTPPGFDKHNVKFYEDVLTDGDSDEFSKVNIIFI